MRQLTSLDAQFLAMETPRTVGHVSGLAIMDPSTAADGTLTAATLTKLIAERVHLVPPFRWRLATVPFGLDHPYWIEDPDFDLDFHIRETAVSPPGGDDQLAELTARICARPLDRAHPLWELYVIHGLQEGRVGLLTKVHHAAVDGMSGAEIMSILYDLEPEGRDIPADAAPSVGRHIPGQLELLGRALVGLPRPLKSLSMIPSTLPRLDKLPVVGALPGALAVSRIAMRVSKLGRGTADGGVLERTNVRAPKTRFNGKITPHRRFAFASLPLDRIKAIKSAAEVTVNDTVVAICAGGLRAWLDERGELPAEPLVSMVPVSVRSREEQGTFGNRVSTMFVPIPTDEADPLRRLQRAHEILSSAKAQHRALPADLLADASQFIPPALAARAARVTSEILSSSRLAPLLNVVISNVPGPREPLYCAGARLEHNYPVSVITDGVGLNITCLSYLDRVDFGIVVDRDMVDDAWSIMAAIERELELVDEVVCGPRPVADPVADPVVQS
ncbi:MAG: diacylglycerol O-acyltransferase / wax synthase [Solirubrobacteraceae bacterium]|nr:diacylglycerol O-acyltransferase / wax synthase [Solirubrobacteraceae bacterium]